MGANSIIIAGCALQYHIPISLCPSIQLQVNADVLNYGADYTGIDHHVTKIAPTYVLISIDEARDWPQSCAWDPCPTRYVSLSQAQRDNPVVTS